MTKTEFIEKLAQELSIAPGELAIDAELSSISSWDSLGKMGVLALIDSELRMVLPQGSLQKCKTVYDLVCLVKPNLSNE
jgi:acyl carrier protein